METVKIFDLSNLISALLGTAIGSIFFPIAIFFFTRWFNRKKMTIILEERKEMSYKVFNLRIHNDSYSTLKNVYAHVTIDNNANDIMLNCRIKFFCSDSPVDFGMLSWSKNIDNKNFPNIDINQGESPDINFIRYHAVDQIDFIEVASEQGFYEEYLGNKSRVVLNSLVRDFTFIVTVTADNMIPKKKTFIYNHQIKKFAEAL